MDGILRRGHLQPFFMGVTSRGLAFAAFFCGAGLVGCATDSFSSANDGGADAADAADATSTDARSDAPSGDTGTDANVCDCAPYWCGCGDCPTERIVCTRRHRTCSLQCLSSCTAIQLAVCAPVSKAAAFVGESGRWAATSTRSARPGIPAAWSMPVCPARRVLALRPAPSNALGRSP